MKKYAVKEIFGPTIQGEGHGAGEPVLFLRFAGCNKWSGQPETKADSQCPFCDTDFVGGSKLTADEIVEQILTLVKGGRLHRYFIKTVVISGGEPTLQLDADLLDKIKAVGFSIYLETNGSRELDTTALGLIDHICCSPKQGRRETVIQRIDSLKVLHPAESPARHLVEFMDQDFMALRKIKDIYIQPVMDANYKANVKRCIDLCFIVPDLKLSTQLHKFIEVQ